MKSDYEAVKGCRGRSGRPPKKGVTKIWKKKKNCWEAKVSDVCVLVVEGAKWTENRWNIRDVGSTLT